MDGLGTVLHLGKAVYAGGVNDLRRAWLTATDAAIEETLRSVANAIGPAGPVASDLMDPLRSASHGGKRLRALLLLASHRAHGGHDETVAVYLAAALELFQTAALLHDDVLDDSDTRRGKPATHKVIAALHDTNGWTGDSETYGRAGGILAGDLALMASHRASSAAHSASPAHGSALANAFVAMADLVTVGQYADMHAAAQPFSALESQREAIVGVMRCKTASYSAEYPLVLGALAAGASSARVAELHEAGVNLGLAFQLRDDVLGLVGEPAVTGKPAGDDIREGKRTLLLWDAWTHGDDATRETIAGALGDRAASDTDVRNAVSAMVDTGALERAEAAIAGYGTAALTVLESGFSDPEGAEVLMEVARSVVQREA